MSYGHLPYISSCLYTTPISLDLCLYLSLSVPAPHPLHTCPFFPITISKNQEDQIVCFPYFNWDHIEDHFSQEWKPGHIFQMLSKVKNKTVFWYSEELFSFFLSCWYLSYLRLVSEMLSKRPTSATAKEAVTCQNHIDSSLWLLIEKQQKKSQMSYSPGTPWWAVAFSFLRFNTDLAYLFTAPSHLQFSNWVF